MAGYPIIIDMRDRLAAVIGAGAVGRRKVAGLLAAGARVRLITLDPAPPACWQDRVELRQRAFHPDDLDGTSLVFAATGNLAVDHAILAAARERGIPANLAGEPESGDFTLPAVLRQGDLLIAVATGGRAPALAGVVRDRLSAEFGREWAFVVEIAARLRTKNLTDTNITIYHSKVLSDLLDNGLAKLVASRNLVEIDRLLTHICGRETTLAGLGLTLPDFTL